MPRKKPKKSQRRKQIIPKVDYRAGKGRNRGFGGVLLHKE